MLQTYVSTNGCVEGQISSKQIERFFKMNELSTIKDPKEADVIVLWACGLTDQRQKDSLGIIRKFQAEMKPEARLIVWGCLTQSNPQALRTIYDGPLIGPLNKNFFEGIPEKIVMPLNEIERAASDNELVSRDTSIPGNNFDSLTNAILLYKRGRDKFRAYMQKSTKLYYIPVATGCTGNCIYCSEQPVFGRIKSRPLDEINNDFKKGLQQGYSRFSLIATDLSSYGKDIDCTLSDLLLKMIRNNGNKNYKIILNQVGFLHLKKIFSDMEEVFASGKIESLECPVQSGSNRILKLMGRRHTAEEWREYMLRINRRFPNIRLKTQFMVGFPTETDEDFQETLKLLDRPLFIDGIYIFKFSKGPKVRASNISGQISEKTKELRYKKLQRKYALMYASNPMQFKRP